MTKLKITEAQYNDLLNELIFINKYDMSFKLLCEMNRYWKEFCFDILDELQKKDIVYHCKDNLLTYLKNHYQDFNLNIDFKDYIELNDYVTLKEWLEESHNMIAYAEDGIFLIQDEDN